MKDTMQITIWDLNPNRIAEINKNLLMAIKDTGAKASITIMSEPPLIARMNLTHRVPLLEIDGNYWNLPPGEPITHKACVQLLQKIALQQA